MTNKPMLSVERELLESCWAALMQKGQVIKALELRALLDKPAKPAPVCVNDLERFEADDGVFVRLGDVIDMLGNEKAAKHQGEAFTYSSKQATNCAGCGLRKHTPLRVDDMGGYVCLTCIDNRLGELLGAERRQVGPLMIQAVAVTRDDDDEGLVLEWLLEGGISEMEFAGMTLFALPEANELCDEDGSAEIYLSPHSVEQPAPVAGGSD